MHTLLFFAGFFGREVQPVPGEEGFLFLGRAGGKTGRGIVGFEAGI